MQTGCLSRCLFRTCINPSPQPFPCPSSPAGVRAASKQDLLDPSTGPALPPLARALAVWPMRMGHASHTLSLCLKSQP